MNSLAQPQDDSSSHLHRAEVAKIVKDFMEAIERVLKTTGRTLVESRTKAATLKEHARIEGDAAGSMSFEGDYSGQFIISFSKKAICEITTNMLFAETPYKNHRDPDCEGAIGEITNQIMGRGRLNVSERTGWRAVNGIPSVLTGERISWVLYTTGTLVVHIPYSTPDHNEMYVEIAIANHPAIGGLKI